MKFTELQTRFLKELGRQDTGRTLVEILNAAKDHYSSIATIDSTRPAEAQIEGRKIFSEFIDALTGAITTQKHTPKPIVQESYE